MKKLLLIFTLSLAPLNSYGAPEWMPTFHNVGDIYTYDQKDTLAVYLEGNTCPNQKNYYYIVPEIHTGSEVITIGNASQMISIILTAKASGKKVRFYPQNNVNSAHCYIRGVWMQD